MDLGIKNKTALVCAASKGLGRGCAEALAEAGVNVTICSRTEKDIKQTAEEISDIYKIKVRSVACDITTEQGRRDALSLQEYHTPYPACWTPAVALEHKKIIPPTLLIK